MIPPLPLSLITSHLNMETDLSLSQWTPFSTSFTARWSKPGKIKTAKTTTSRATTTTIQTATTILADVWFS